MIIGQSQADLRSIYKRSQFDNELVTKVNNLGAVAEINRHLSV